MLVARLMTAGISTFRAAADARHTVHRGGERDVASKL